MSQPDRVANELALQRNQAMNALAVASAQRDEARATLEASFVALDQCILSGQVPQEDVVKLIASIPGFAEWRGRSAGSVG